MAGPAPAGRRSWAPRRLAQADSALAHVFGFHHLQVAGVLLYGTPEQHAYFLEPTVARNLFWGNALNPLDRRVVARAELDGYRIDGVKSFSSGSVGSDLLTFSAWHKPSGTALIAALPTRVEGITVNPTGTPSASARPTAARCASTMCGSSPCRCCRRRAPRRPRAPRCARRWRS